MSAYAHRFPPREDLRKKLREGAKKIVGFDIYDVRWDSGRVMEQGGEKVEVPGRDCLCIFEKDRRGNETIRVELREDPTEPFATKTFTYQTPDGEHRETTLPLDEDDDHYVEKVVGRPRQITEADVKEALDAAREALTRSKMIAEKLKKQREAQQAEQLRIREEYTAEAAKELANFAWQLRSGKNAFVDLGHHSEAGTGAAEGFTVNDRRRFKDE